MGNIFNILDTPASSSITLLQTLSVTDLAQLEFTDIPDSYNQLRIAIDYMNPAGSSVNVRPFMQMSLDNGSNYLNTNEYDWQVLTIDQGSAGSTAQKGQAATTITMSGGSLLQDNTGVGYAAIINLLNYTNAAANNTARMFFSYNAAEDSTPQVFGGRGQAFIRISTAINAMKLYFTSGNLDAEARLYGIT